MAMPLVFRAVAHECHAANPREPFDEPERELLTVILDRAVPRINGAVHEQLAAVLPDKLRPGDAARLAVPQEALTRSERRHPHVVPARRHPAPAKPRGENPDSV